MFKQQYSIYLLTLGGSIAVSVGLQMLLPFPFGFLAALGFFLVFPFIFQKKLIAKVNGITKTKFRCIVCQKAHGLDQCPRCGSKMRKADFG